MQENLYLQKEWLPAKLNIYILCYKENGIMKLSKTYLHVYKINIVYPFD